MFIPRSKDNRGIETYDSCQMYNRDLDLIVEYLEHPNGDHPFIYDQNETISKLKSTFISQLLESI